MKNIILVSALVLGLGTAATAQQANSDQRSNIKKEQQDVRGEKPNKMHHQKDAEHKGKKEAPSKGEHKKGDHKKDGQKQDKRSAMKGQKNKNSHYAKTNKQCDKKAESKSMNNAKSHKGQRA